MLTDNLAVKKGSVTCKTIDSQYLLDMVNAARKQCGEPEVRNNKFIEKVVDELEGEFYTKSVKPSGANGGRPVEVIEMTIKQALRVAACESKAVRAVLWSINCKTCKRCGYQLHHWRNISRRPFQKNLDKRY